MLLGVSFAAIVYGVLVQVPDWPPLEVLERPRSDSGNFPAEAEAERESTLRSDVGRRDVGCKFYKKYINKKLIVAWHWFVDVIERS